MRLSRFAAHNAFHHCEQCHNYCEAGPAAQVRHRTDALHWTSLPYIQTNPCKYPTLWKDFDKS